ncbi:2-isopropylmalate synthase [Gammaproteobacteria bacterium]|nr:2-isopropylmalate synthase [Gammaproteobacteria bacterium]MDC3027153.1 2-isopropylmalate synthase [Gammaproteobacteria bacterium]
MKKIDNSAISKYSSFEKIKLKNRSWPTNQITNAPIWCSVDLRDGNQALIEPMGIEKKLRFFAMLIELGFKEIEIGFPSASETEFNFVRKLIDDNLIPSDVKIQVLSQAREHLIKRTFEATEGAKNVIFHLYNSTSTLQREVVFKKDKAGITKIATEGAELVQKLSEEYSKTNWQFEYSPESFTGTELDYAAEVCNEVNNIWHKGNKNKTIINLPATVELSTPNIYADQIQWMNENLKNRDKIILSLHPHNDRGTAVAAAELGLMAGADRIEGTLFGNGERTGNVDIVTLGLNLFTQGIDPQLDFSDINKTMREVEYCNQLPVHPRHPYAGDLVFTAFSGSHQDAIKKGFDEMRNSNDSKWRVPYLPIDPEDVGRTYEAVIRINSQSGKGGISYILEQDYGVTLPRRMQIDFSQVIQKQADETGKELDSKEIWESFENYYLKNNAKKISYNSHEIQSSKEKDVIKLSLIEENKEIQIEGTGNGPIDAFINALNDHLSSDFKVSDYHQHSISSGSDASAAAYIEIQNKNSSDWGAGIDQNTTVASYKAILNCINKILS